MMIIYGLLIVIWQSFKYGWRTVIGGGGRPDCLALPIFLFKKNNKLIRKLRSSCNILIAFDSLLSIIYASGHIIPLIAIFTRQLIPYSACLLFFLPSLFSGETTSYMIVTIGLDRFLHVLFPIWYVGI